MFEKREFSVRVRKADQDTPATDEGAMSSEEKIVSAVYFTKIILRDLGIGVCAYVLLDTFRQVQIAKNTNCPHS